MVFFEWVSKNGVFFFFPTLFFFSRPLKSSEWVTGKLFLGKKKKTTFDRKKKKNNEKNEIRQKVPFFTVFDLFLEFSVSQLSEWHANFSWEKKKTACFFFFQNTEKKKQKLPKVSEWVPPNLFRGKKKKRYLWLN